MVKDAALNPASNLIICYSMGGRQDHLIDVTVDRHADVFPDLNSRYRTRGTSPSTGDLLRPGP
jgi:hypothetical protein